jgi:hypothetical protein
MAVVSGARREEEERRGRREKKEGGRAAGGLIPWPGRRAAAGISSQGSTTAAAPLSCLALWEEDDRACRWAGPWWVSPGLREGKGKPKSAQAVERERKKIFLYKNLVLIF